MKEPTISVVVAAYNSAQFLNQAIDSVLSQSHPADEILLVDDASSDATVFIAKSYGSKIRVIQRDRNGGVAACRNTGIQAAQGDLIAFLDADDIWVPYKLEHQLQFVEQYPQAAVYHAGWFWGNKSGVPVGTVFGEPSVGLPGMLFSNPILPSSAMIRRDVLLAVDLFDESLAGSDDWDLFLRLLLANYTIVGQREPLAIFRLHGANTSAKLAHMEAEGTTVLSKTFASLPSNSPWKTQKQAAFANHYLLFAARYLCAGDGENASRCISTTRELTEPFDRARFQRLLVAEALRDDRLVKAGIPATINARIALLTRTLDNALRPDGLSVVDYRQTIALAYGSASLRAARSGSRRLALQLLIKLLLTQPHLLIQPEPLRALSLALLGTCVSATLKIFVSATRNATTALRHHPSRHMEHAV